MVNEEMWLPVGSVVRLKDGEKPVMIAGFLVQDARRVDLGTTWDTPIRRGGARARTCSSTAHRSMPSGSSASSMPMAAPIRRFSRSAMRR